LYLSLSLRSTKIDQAFGVSKQLGQLGFMEYYSKNARRRSLGATSTKKRGSNKRTSLAAAKKSQRGTSSTGEIFDPGDFNDAIEERVDKRGNPYFYHRQSGKTGWTREELKDEDAGSEISFPMSDASHGYSVGANPMLHSPSANNADERMSVRSTQVRK
jgi:hypothetical protein